MNLFELQGTISLDGAGAINAINAVMGGAKSLTSSLGSMAVKIGGTAMKAVGTATAAGIAGYGALTVAALKATSSLEQNMGGSEQVFQQYAGTMQATAQTAYQSMGLATSDYLQTANRMGALFQGSGMDMQKSADLTTQAMQRAADVASIMGIDTAWAMESITGAAKGNFTMMDNLGVAINDTTLQAYALEKGITKSTQAMTTQEKVGLAMDMFMERTAYAAGNYARENDTLAGSLSTAKAAMTNFLDGSGGVKELVPALENAGEVITENLIEIMPRLSEGLAETTKQLAPMIPDLLTTAIPGMAEGGVALVEGFVDALPNIATALVDSAPVFVEGFGDVFEAVSENLPEVMEVLTPALADGISGALSLVGVDVESRDIQRSLESIFSGIGKVGGTIGTELGGIKDIFVNNIGKIGTVLSENGVTIDGFFAGLDTTISTISEPISSGLDAVLKGFTALTDWATTDGTLLNTALGGIGDVFSGVAGGVSSTFEALGYVFEGDMENASKSGAEVVNRTSEGLGKAFIDAGEWISGVAADFWNFSMPMIFDMFGMEYTGAEKLDARGILTVLGVPEESISVMLKPEADTASAEQAVGEIETVANTTVQGPSFDRGNIDELEAMYGGVPEIAAEAGNVTVPGPTIDTSSAEEAPAAVSAAANAIADLTSIGTVALTVDTSSLSDATAQVSQTAAAIQSAFEFGLSTPAVDTSSLGAAVTAAQSAASAIQASFSGISISIPAASSGGSGASGGGASATSAGGGAAVASVGAEYYASGAVLMRPTEFGFNPYTNKRMIGGEAGPEAIAPVATLQSYVSDAVASQNAAQTSYLSGIESKLDKLDTLIDLFSAFSDMSLKINDREFGRLVKKAR